MSNELFDDVKAADSVMSQALVRIDDQQSSEVSALERGRRERPDGTVEQYERVEFRDQA